MTFVSSNAGWRRPSLALVLGLALVGAVRFLTRPFGLWEYDEFLFVAGIERFDPVQHRPHPPGYPLLIGLGKAFRWLCGDAFHALVALAIVSSLIGFVALFAAFRRLAADAFPEGDPARWEAIALIGALLFHLSPAMLVHGPMPMSDPPMLMFLSLALWAATRLGEGGAGAALAFGAFASCAIGCRPQVAVAVLPMVAVTLFLVAGWRKRGLILAGFTALSLCWFVPLVVAAGGPRGLLALLGKQGALVAQFDSGEARLPWSPQGVAFRFIAHPWGDRWTSLPVLALAAIGSFQLARVRPRSVLPLATLALVHLAFCLLVMEPRDGVRYALPAVLAVAFVAALGIARLCVAVGGISRRFGAVGALPAWAMVLPVALLIAGFGLYAGPLLAVRSTTPSPTVQAVRWIEGNLPKRAVFLADPELEAPALHLLPGHTIYKILPGLERLAHRRGVPLYLLGDGESSWAGAQAFRWPESDAYGKLTRNHYRVVSVSPIPPAWRYEALRGVYGFEPSLRERGLRWMSAEAAIRIEPRGAAALVLTLGLPAQAPWTANQVVVSGNSIPIQEVEVPRGGTARVRIPLAQASQFDVSFKSRLAFFPEDGREHAVQLLDVELLGH